MRGGRPDPKSAKGRSYRDGLGGLWVIRFDPIGRALTKGMRNGRLSIRAPTCGCISCSNRSGKKGKNTMNENKNQTPPTQSLKTEVTEPQCTEEPRAMRIHLKTGVKGGPALPSSSSVLIATHL